MKQIIKSFSLIVSCFISLLGQSVNTVTGGVETAWVRKYQSEPGVSSSGNAIAVDPAGNVYVTGSSFRVLSNSSDYATVKYNAMGEEKWIELYDGPGESEDYATAIAVDLSGNTYVTGTSVGIGTSTDYATVKYDVYGIIQWVDRYNGPGNSEDRPTSMVVDSSGNVYVTGSSVGSGTLTDYATIKYNTDGDLQWVSRYSGPKNLNDSPAALVVDTSGNVYVTGYTDALGRYDEYLDSNKDYATIKYNAIGIEQWIARYNGPANGGDDATALAIDATGNVFVTGRSTNVSSNPDFNYYLDFATIKYNPNGIVQWVRRYDSLASGAPDIVIDRSGNVYVAGFAYDSTLFGPGCFATLKYNTDGVKQWIAHYNRQKDQLNSYYSVPSSFAVDKSGNVFVTGTCAISTTDWDDKGDYVTLMYNSTGVEQWVAVYHEANDGASDLAIDESGNVYVTGFSGGIGFHGIGNKKYGTIKYKQVPVSVQNVNVGFPKEFTLEQNYPNPFNPSTTIRYSIPSSATVKLAVYDLLGREIATLVNEEQSAGWKEVEWNANNFASGMYFYKLEAGSFTATKKLMLLK